MDTTSPLNYIADFSISDPIPVRNFGFLTNLTNDNFEEIEKNKNKIENQLNEWINNHSSFIELANSFPVLQRLLPLSG
jgi:hypothetical protein